jgi:Glycogen synthase
MQETHESRSEEDLKLLDPNFGKPVIIAHFHEWLAGVALILICKRNLNMVSNAEQGHYFHYPRDLTGQILMRRGCRFLQ